MKNAHIFKRQEKRFKKKQKDTENNLDFNMEVSVTMLYVNWLTSSIIDSHWNG